jgi:hypothetical protein
MVATTDTLPWRDLPEGADSPAVRAAFTAFFAAGGNLNSPTSGDDLAMGHREALAQFAPTADPAALTAVVEAMFAQADVEFEASGAPPWVHSERTDTPPESARVEISAHLAQCMRTATHGLLVVGDLSQHRPDASEQLLDALRRASKQLNHRLGWLSAAGGYSTLGLSSYFDDAPSILQFKQQDVEAALLAKIKPSA